MEPTVKGNVLDVMLLPGSNYVRFTLVEQLKYEQEITVDPAEDEDHEVTVDGVLVEDGPSLVAYMMTTEWPKVVHFECAPDDLGRNFGVTWRCKFTRVEASESVNKVYASRKEKRS